MKLNRITIRILVSVILIFIVLIASAHVTVFIRTQSQKSCWKELQSEATEIERNLNEYFTGVKNSIIGQVNMFSDVRDIKTLQMVKKLQASSNGSLKTKLRLYLPDGYAILEDGIHNDISNLIDYSSIESKTVYISDVHKNILNPEQSILEVLQPVSEKGQIIAMFSGMIELDVIKELIKTDAYYEHAEYYIVNRKNGDVFLDSQRDDIWDFREVTNEISEQGYSSEWFYKAVMSGNEAECIFLSPKPGHNLYVSSIPSQVDEWSIVFLASEKDVLARTHGMMNVMWIYFAFEVIAFAAFLIWSFYDYRSELEYEKKQAEENAQIEADAHVAFERVKHLETIASQKTQLEKQQRELEDALNMAQSANRAKTVFLNNMSHDIRTPMNAIIGYTTLASSHIDNKEQVTEYLEKIDQSSKHLLSLINDVLDMSRIESGKMMIEEREENLRTIIHNLENILYADVHAKNLDFEVNLDELKDGIVYCDKLRLNQILLNILSNAVKYTQKGGKISLEVKQYDSRKEGFGFYEFIIKDNGMGMKPEFLKTIYQPFTRVSSSTVSGIQGTGLGMTITKNLVEMMEGNIDISSKENEGTTVVVEFDFKFGESLISEEETSKKTIDYDISGKKILIVEDSAMNLQIVTELLKEEGCTVLTAKNGAVAVEMVEKAKPGDIDIIFMDIQMPVMNGYEATKKIRAIKNESLSSLPIIAMTANAFAEDRKEALASGMNEHVSKPLDMNIVKETIARFIPVGVI